MARLRNPFPVATFLALAGVVLVGLAGVAAAPARSVVPAGFAAVHHGLPAPPTAAVELLAQARAGDDGFATGQAIFGVDDRVPVGDTTAWPWRTVVHLYITDASGEFAVQCSGSLVNVNVVLTAAHCVVDEFTGEYVTGVLVVPGETPLAEPFGSAWATGLSAPVGYFEDAGPEFDFALVHLDETPWDESIGPFGVVAAAPDGYFSSPDVGLVSAGYPGDKPLGSMWYTIGIDALVDGELIYTRMDAYPGQSGSPIYTLDVVTADMFVVGVYSTEGLFSNQAVRFTASHLEALQEYCADDGCTLTTVDLSQPLPPPMATATATPPPASATPAPSPTATPTPTEPPAPLGPFDYRIHAPAIARD